MTTTLAILTLASWYHSPFTGLTCATRDYPIGARLLVTDTHNHLSVVVTVRERGPALWVIKKHGVRIDLSERAFEQLEGKQIGLAQVRVKQL